MLFKNHQKVELKEEPLYKKHEKEFEAFLFKKDNIVFRTHDTIKFNPSGYKEQDRTQTIPTHVLTRNASGDDNDYWVYCAKAPKILQNGEKEYDHTPIKITRESTVSTKEKDKIFFLMYLSSAAASGRIFVVNEEEEAEKQVVTLGQKAEIDFLLFNDRSPVSEVILRRVAKAFGVSNEESMTKAKVALKLKDIVETADILRDEFRNSYAFLKAIDEDPSVGLRGQIQEAIDAERIKFEVNENSWYYTDEDGNKIKKIMTVDVATGQSNTKRTNELIKLFVSNEDRQKELARLLNYQVDDLDFSKYEYQSLKTFAAKHGVSGKGTQLELVERLTNYFNENKNNQHFDISVLIVSEKKPAEV